MAKTWVLDTETKGTGAHIAPLPRGAGGAPSKLELVHLYPRAARGASSGAADAQPAQRTKRFKVLDVLSGRVLAEDVGAREAIGALRSLRKAVDALVYVREEEDGGRWRLLTLGETGSLWTLRERDPA
jgi:hypothetical protein